MSKWEWITLEQASEIIKEGEYKGESKYSDINSLRFRTRINNLSYNGTHCKFRSKDIHGITYVHKSEVDSYAKDLAKYKEGRYEEYLWKPAINVNYNEYLKLDFGKYNLDTKGFKKDVEWVTDYEKWADLTIQVKPEMFYGHTVRGNINSYFWGKQVRPEILKEHNYTCQYCGYKPESSNTKFLHVHEIEKYDIEKGICELVGIEVICSKCHDVHHYVRSFRITDEAGKYELIKRFFDVNDQLVLARDADYMEFEMYVAFTRSILRDVNTYVNMRIADGSINFGNIKYKISCGIPYKEEVINQLSKKELYVS